MTPERFRRIEEVFHAALELQGAERERCLAAQCGGDEDLRLRVEALLRGHEPTSSFLEPPPSTGAASVDGTPRRIGRYRIERLIASGGMGAVYEAEQERPLRRVALKVMRAGLTSETSRRRFEFESQIVASLRHPGIAQVYEAGVHEEFGVGVPFFAMELVNGPAITEFCLRRSVDLDGRVRLMQLVCEAVRCAHQRGVIHRDIKPSNILVETPEGEQDAAPKVIDFGIARVVAGDTPAPTMGTEAGGVLGTLAYMSPEQCAGSARSVDIRSDVYSLGVVLYELVCDAMPYDVDGKPIGEVVATIASKPPVRPSLRNARVRGDLETILLKALEKDPERRYQSAADLGRDLERYLSLQPIEARPPTALYQMRMFARRHRALVGAAAAMVAVLVVATIVSVMFALAARRQEARAHRRADFLLGVVASANPWFPPAIPGKELADYEPWDEWQNSPWPYAGVPGRAASVADLLKAAGDRVQTDFADDPATRARLGETLGWTLQRMLSTERHPSQGPMLERAESLLRDALETRRRMLGDQHQDTIRCMMRLAEFLDYTHGKVAEGGELYDEAWRICVEVYGPHDAFTLHALRGWANNRAFLQQKWEEAKERLADAVLWAQERGRTPRRRC